MLSMDHDGPPQNKRYKQIHHEAQNTSDAARMEPPALGVQA